MIAKCERCGEDGLDRRTLWMASMYEIKEFIPEVQECAVRGQYVKKITSTECLGFSIPRFEEFDPGKSPEIYKFYTLFVCKDCRADWHKSIKHWWDKKPVVRHVVERETWKVCDDCQEYGEY